MPLVRRRGVDPMDAKRGRDGERTEAMQRKGTSVRYPTLRRAEADSLAEHATLVVRRRHVRFDEYERLACRLAR